MSTHNLCFKQKYEKYQSFLSEHFQFLEVKFSIYLNKACFRNGHAKKKNKKKKNDFLKDIESRVGQIRNTCTCCQNF